MMLIKQGMATAMVKRPAHTTGSAASGVNVMGQPADSGGRRPSGSRWSARHVATYHRILEVLDFSVNGYERDRQGPHRRSR